MDYSFVFSTNSTGGFDLWWSPITQTILKRQYSAFTENSGLALQMERGWHTTDGTTFLGFNQKRGGNVHVHVEKSRSPWLSTGTATGKARPPGCSSQISKGAHSQGQTETRMPEMLVWLTETPRQPLLDGDLLPRCSGRALPKHNPNHVHSTQPCHFLQPSRHFTSLLPFRGVRKVLILPSALIFQRN